MSVIERDTTGCGETRAFPISLLDKAITPQLAAGDMLILRGDVIHRSGKREHMPFRLAMSLRALQTPTAKSVAPMCIRRRATTATTSTIASLYNPMLCDPQKRRT